MSILVTGAAGFIGYHVSNKLLDRGEKVVGVDSINDHYDVRLKEARLAHLTQRTHFDVTKLDIADRNGLAAFFDTHRIDVVINLAAQAGVRYSLNNPAAYIDSNVV